MTFQNEREEIAAIAEMLTDGEDIYFLLGGAGATQAGSQEGESTISEGGTRHAR